MKRRTMSAVYIEEKQKNTRGDETQRLDCMAMLLAQMKMIYIYIRWKAKPTILFPAARGNRILEKKSASLVIYISVGYSEFFLFLQPASTYSCQILLDTPSLIFRAYIVYFIDYVIQSMYRRRSSCYIMYTIYTLNVSITNRATSAPIRKIYSLLSEKKTMTLMSTLLPLLQAVLKCRYQDSVEMKA